MVPLKYCQNLPTAAVAVNYKLADTFCYVSSKNACVLENLACHFFITNKLLMNGFIYAWEFVTAENEENDSKSLCATSQTEIF